MSIKWRKNRPAQFDVHTTAGWVWLAGFLCACSLNSDLSSSVSQSQRGMCLVQMSVYVRVCVRLCGVFVAALACTVDGWIQIRFASHRHQPFIHLVNMNLSIHPSIHPSIQSVSVSSVVVYSSIYSTVCLCLCVCGQVDQAQRYQGRVARSSVGVLSCRFSATLRAHTSAILTTAGTRIGPDRHFHTRTHTEREKGRCGGGCVCVCV